MERTLCYMVLNEAVQSLLLLGKWLQLAKAIFGQWVYEIDEGGIVPNSTWLDADNSWHFWSSVHLD